MHVCLPLLLVAGCGRLAFSPLADPDALDGVVDSGPGPTDGLRLWFELEPQNLLVDSISGAPATCSACPTSVAGMRGGGAAFSMHCIEFPTRPELEVQELSLSLWIRVSASARRASVFGKGLNATLTNRNSYEMWMRAPNAGAVPTYFNTNHGTNNDELEMLGAVEETWHHWAGTYSPGRKLIYLDGTLRVTDPTPDPTPIPYDAEPLRVGCDRDVGIVGEWFVGVVDDVRLYDRELTSEEIVMLAIR